MTDFERPDWRARADQLSRTKTDQIKADQKDSESRAADLRSERLWKDRLNADPLAKLKLSEALLGRYDIEPDNPTTAEMRLWLRDRVVPMLKDVNPRAVLGDPRLVVMVRGLFGESGVRRLEELSRVKP